MPPRFAYVHRFLVVATALCRRDSHKVACPFHADRAASLQHAATRKLLLRETSAIE